MFYARLVSEDTSGRSQLRWIPLANAITPSEARDKLRELQVQRDQAKLVLARSLPRLGDYITRYVSLLAHSGKTSKTISTEKGYLSFWREELGFMQMDKIRPHLISAGLHKLRAQGLMPRSCNLSLTILRNVLRSAKVDGFITAIPTEGLQRFRVEHRPRKLVTPAEVDRLCASAAQATKNAVQFVDYIRFLQFSGCREREALKVRWEDVNFNAGQLTVGAVGGTKNREYRIIDLNSSLEGHLRSMWNRRAPDSDWLFPSPQRGDADLGARTFRESLRLVRAAAGMPSFGFHDLRHHFISYSVMSSIDYMTIARWVGHKDGGVLIGKVYGHLADDHRRRMAQKVCFV